MPNRPILYYITDSTQFSRDEHTRRQLLLKKIQEAAQFGVDFIQLREKDLPIKELESLTWAAAEIARKSIAGSRKAQMNPRLLVNSRTDVAMTCAADGVHLRSDDIQASEVRRIWRSETTERPMISVSCHSPKGVAQAAEEGADYALFGPVFEKRNTSKVEAAGIEGLRQACQHKIPVLALGGVTLENARSCMDAGASGIAGIRLFQENDIVEVVKKLRS